MSGRDKGRERERERWGGEREEKGSERERGRERKIYEIILRRINLGITLHESIRNMECRNAVCS